MYGFSVCESEVRLEIDEKSDLNTMLRVKIDDLERVAEMECHIGREYDSGHDELQEASPSSRDVLSAFTSLHANRNNKQKQN